MSSPICTRWYHNMVSVVGCVREKKREEKKREARKKAHVCAIRVQNISGKISDLIRKHMFSCAVNVCLSTVCIWSNFRLCVKNSESASVTNSQFEHELWLTWFDVNANVEPNARFDCVPCFDGFFFLLLLKVLNFNCVFFALWFNWNPIILETSDL